jgi:hypothetical protein
MPPQPTPQLHARHVRTAIGAAAVAVTIGALGYVVWRSGVAKDEPSTEEQRLHVLQQLSASATSPATPAEK